MSSTFSNTNLTGSHIGEQDLANGGSARTTVGTDSVSNRPSGGDPSQDEELPPQLHAGKVGYGPNYHAGPDAGDKLTGFKEELLGKVKKDRDLAQHGHDLRTGELRRNEQDDEGAAAFQSSDQKQQTQSQAPPTRTESQAQPGDGSSASVGQGESTV